MIAELQAELRDLLARSSDCVWRRDKSGYGQCWAVDGEWRILGQVFRGREAIEAAWWGMMQPFKSVWQLSHNASFAHDSEHPVGRIYLEETLRPASGEIQILKGIYHDSYIKEHGAWRFFRRHIDIVYLGPVDLSGRWFPTVDYGPAPHDPEPGRSATPTMEEAYGA